MTNKERRLKAIKEKRGEKAQQVQELWALDTPDNDLTEDQKAEVLELTKEIESLKKDQAEAESEVALEKEVNEASRGVTAPSEEVQTDVKVTHEPPRMKSIGEQFTDSEGYQRLFGEGKSVDSIGGRWSTGQIDLQTKATVQSGGTLDAFAPYTQFIPGVVETLFQSLSVADLLPSGNATSPQITYNQEIVATNAAAGVAESALKPESAFDFQEVTEPVRKIATFLPISDDMLEFAPQVQNYLNARLNLFVRQEEERQILKGTGAASNELQGLASDTAFTSRGIGSAIVSGQSGTAVYPDFHTIMTNQRGSSQLEPDGLIMHPTQWGSIIRFTDANDQFYGGGPLTTGAYGAGRNVPASQFSTGHSLWGVPVHVTTAIGLGTALLGCFRQAAQLWRRGGVTVEASNSHSDFFQRNQTALRAEERLALAVYRPSAFTVITFS